MKSGFQNSTLDVRTRDGLDDVLLEPLVFIRANGDVIRAPVGGTTNGFSVPRCLQNVVPPTGGDWFSSILHDSAYQKELQVCVENKWIPAGYSKKQADSLILEAMTAQGTNRVIRQVVYWAVRLFGRGNFKI